MRRQINQKQRDGLTAALLLFCNSAVFSGNGSGRAAIPLRAAQRGKIPTECRSTQGSFSFWARYCRSRMVDPT
jgi:hypothetical protein